MGVQIPLNEAQVTLVFTVAGNVRPMVMTFGVRPDVQGATASQIASGVRALYVSSTLGSPGAFSSSYTWTETRVQKMTSTGIAFAGITQPVVGTATANTVPVNGAVLIRKETQDGGRKNRGRMFWPPMAFNEAIVSPAGVIAAAELAAEQTKWNTFVSSLSSGDYPMVVQHSDGSPSTLVSGVSLSNLLATQRRRMR